MIISIENTVVRKLHSIKGVQERQWMHHTAAANTVILFVSKSTTLSQKNDTDLACHNSDVHEPILIRFDTSVADRVSYQIVIYFPLPQKLRVFT